MTSRREFLGQVAAGLGAAALRPERAGADDVSTSMFTPIGLQLYSLRVAMKQDVPGTLAKVKAMGFHEVEGAGTWGLTPAAMRAEMDKAGLRCLAAHSGLERLRDDRAGAFAETKALGAKWVVCPWIPHEGDFKKDDALKAADLFNGVAKAAEAEGLKFAYHCHGYEFVPGADGTLWDTFVAATDPKLVSFEIDVFWAKAGGVDPAQLIAKLPGRVAFLHLKDMRKGLSLPPASSKAPDDSNVVLGTGQVDWPGVLKAAEKNGASVVYYIEDESPDPLGQIPKSVAYLKTLKI